MTQLHTRRPDRVDLRSVPGQQVGRPLSWQARHLAASPFLHQIPLLFWVVAAVRPATIAGIGLQSAEGYFALCQAVDELGLQARAWGVGDWQGSRDRVTAATVPDELNGHNTSHYGAFSRLGWAGDIAAALDRFPAGSLDLVLLDSRSMADETTALTERLVRLASPGGLLLVQGPPPATGPASKPADGFLKQICMAHPAIVFPGPGETAATLVLTGPRPQPQLRHLASLPPGATELSTLQDEMARLGRWPVQEWQNLSRARQIATMEAEAEAARAAAAERLGEMKRAAGIRRLRDARILAEELERLAEELQQVRQERDQALLSADAAQAELGSLRIRHYDEIEALRADVAWLEQELERHRTATGDAAPAHGSPAPVSRG